MEFFDTPSKVLSDDDEGHLRRNCTCLGYDKINILRRRHIKSRIPYGNLRECAGYFIRKNLISRTFLDRDELSDNCPGANL